MILVPIKSLRNAKQRLAPLLSPDEREELARAMLQDVATALAQAGDRAPVAFVTREPFALALARQHGFSVIEDNDEHGETAAIATATRVAIDRGAAWTLVVPGDAPLIRAAEIERVLTIAPECGAVLAPDWRWRGSNAVLRRPADLFPLRFGDDSFLPHLSSAAQKGVPVVVLELTGVALDVDRPADIEELLGRPPASHAQRLLTEWNVATRLAELHARAAGE